MKRNAVNEGDDVSHRTFGRGRVEKVEDTRATVRFAAGDIHIVDFAWLMTPGSDEIETAAARAELRWVHRP